MPVAQYPEIAPPSSLPRLSIQESRIGDQILAVAARRSDKLYVTEVKLPAGYRLEIGHTYLAMPHEVVAQGFTARTYRLVIQTR